MTVLENIKKLVIFYCYKKIKFVARIHFLIFSSIIDNCQANDLHFSMFLNVEFLTFLCFNLTCYVGANNASYLTDMMTSMFSSAFIIFKYVLIKAVSNSLQFRYSNDIGFKSRAFQLLIS